MKKKILRIAIFAIHSLLSLVIFIPLSILYSFGVGLHQTGHTLITELDDLIKLYKRQWEQL